MNFSNMAWQPRPEITPRTLCFPPLSLCPPPPHHPDNCCCNIKTLHFWQFWCMLGDVYCLTNIYHPVQQPQQLSSSTLSKSTISPVIIFSHGWYCNTNYACISNNRVHKSPHKFMLTSYMKYFAKFLVIFIHNTSFSHFYFIFHTS